MRAARGEGRNEIREAGFTLLEVVLVLAVIVLALTLSYPSITRGSAVIQLRSSARDVLNTLRFAREKAIAEQRILLVSVDPETRQLLLTDEFGEGGGQSYTLPKGIGFERLVSGSTTVNEGRLVIRFLPNGSADSAAIFLRSGSGAIMRVVTDPVTGGAKVLAATEEARQ